MIKSMIFHHPLPIRSEGTSGSQVRPFRMSKAFKQIGYQVELVAGYADERKKTIERIKKDVLKGRKFEFIYSESLTNPMLLSEKYHFPTHPLLDFGFFKWLKKRGVPVGFFYRDAYWRFPEYNTQVPWHKRAVLVPFFWYDWLQYLHLVDHLFLPSLAMKEILPSQWPDNRVSALPPGCNISSLSKQHALKTSPPGLELLYVGGITPPFYDLTPTIEAVGSLDHVCLTVCCRASEWEKFRSYYTPIDSAKIRIVHTHGKELEAYYATADIFVLVRSLHPFSVIAMPVKLFEALGYGVPIVTSGGTEVAHFVEREGIGWIVSSQDEFRPLLSYLRVHPEETADKQRRVRVVQNRHTWVKRAQMVAGTLTTAADRN
ncbi:MAG: glycosyltransferase [Chloroflexota bacterium]|nr:glycosyltransferase [Chloroflexota bacterium]